MHPLLFIYPAINLGMAIYEGFQTEKKVIQDDDGSFRVVHSNSEDYSRYKTVFEKAIDANASIQNYLRDIGVSKKIIFVEKAHNFFQAFGTDIWGKRSPIIATCPSLYQKHPEASSFVIKHEIAHIKNCDMPLIRLSVSVIGIASAVLFNTFLSLIPSFVLCYVAQMIAGAAITYFREVAADNLAIKHASKEELIGGYVFFKGMIQMNKTLYKLQPRQWQLTSQGENLFDISHPSLNSRSKLIEKAFRSRFPGASDLDDLRGKIDTMETNLIYANLTIYEHQVSSSLIGIIYGITKQLIAHKLTIIKDKLADLDAQIMRYQEDIEKEDKRDPNSELKKYYQDTLSWKIKLKERYMEDLKKNLELESHPLYFLNPRQDRQFAVLKNGSYNWPAFLKRKLA